MYVIISYSEIAIKERGKNMSWNSIVIDDLNIESDDQCINITWSCPRCDHKQTSEVSISDLVYGTEVTCNNVDICGDRQSYFSLGFHLEYGSFKGLSDRPLTVI